MVLGCSLLLYSEGSYRIISCIDGYSLICRGLFIIDAKGILRQITMNDLPVC